MNDSLKTYFFVFFTISTFSGDKVAKSAEQTPIPFTITPQSLENIREIKSVPDFKIR